MMNRRLPPLKALRAFEAAARHLSFTRAAIELAVTQGAISKQINLLEEHLGIRLFARAGRQVKLTSQGALYLPSVTDAFDRIASATSAFGVDKDAGETLTVNILPSLSSRWLIPLLDDFRKKHPKYSVRVEIGDGCIDFAGNDADIAIRAGRRNSWKRLHAEALMGEELLPVAAPRVLTASPVKHPRDFAQHTLLQHTTRMEMWPEYLMSMGVKSPKIKHALGFEHFFMLIQAALDGLGIAQIPRFLIKEELKQGKLKVAYDKPFKSPYRYYLICPKPNMETRPIRIFCSWLREKAQLV